MIRQTLIALMVFTGSIAFLPQLRAQDANTEIDRMKLNIQESERLNQEQFAKVNGNMDTLNGNMTAIVNQMNAITGKIQELESRIKQLEAELAQSKQQIQAEAAARQESIKNFASQVSREISTTPRTPAPRPAVQDNPPPEPTANSGSNASPAGEYLEYTVQKGATLSTIAKAYNVSVSDIRRANNMSNSAILRIGQKLLIPKK